MGAKVVGLAANSTRQSKGGAAVRTPSTRIFVFSRCVSLSHFCRLGFLSSFSLSSLFLSSPVTFSNLRKYPSPSSPFSSIPTLSFFLFPTLPLFYQTTRLPSQRLPPHTPATMAAAAVNTNPPQSETSSEKHKPNHASSPSIASKAEVNGSDSQEHQHFKELQK